MGQSENRPSGGVFPAELLKTLSDRGGKPDRGIVEGVRKLSTLFTTGRGGLGGDYLADRALRRAYLLYFLPVNFAKVACLLEEMPPLPARPLRVLDLGCGLGAGALAVQDHLSRRGVAEHVGSEIVAVDRSREALHEVEACWASMAAARSGPPQCVLRTQMADVERFDTHAPWAQGTFDLIVFANSLNELFGSLDDAIAYRVHVLSSLLDRLAPDGTLMIVEPALRETTRALHHVRDRLLGMGQATVYSPCLHERPCPALVRADDWCHEERGWLPPPMVREIDRKVGFIKDALKFSYLLLRKDGQTIVDRTPDVYRVVSEVLVMKGDQRAWLCNEAGRPLVGRLNKARTAANAAFDHWHRGAIVRVRDIERRDTVSRITGTTKVDLVRPAD